MVGAYTRASSALALVCLALAPDASANTSTTAAPRPEAPLPPGEAERMAPHPVDSPRLRFEPGKGLAVESADGAFRLATRLRGQVRYTARPSEDDDSRVHELQLRRVRVAFTGHAFGPQMKFKLELAVSPNDQGIVDNVRVETGSNLAQRTALLDLYFDFRHFRDFELRVGQYKLPSNRTRVISSGDLQLVDRSIVNAEFTLDRDVGLDLRSRNLGGLDLFRYYAGVTVGRGRDAKGFDDLGLNYFVRVEVLPFGLFKDYKEVDFARTKRPRLSVGAAYAYQDRNRGLRRITSRPPADGGTTEHHLAYADFIFKYAGFSAQSEWAYRRGQRNPGDAVDETGAPVPVEAPRDGWGGMVQAGYLIPWLPLEFAARFGMVRAIGDASETSLGDLTEVGGGVSWYMGRHPYKIQADVFRIFDEGASSGGVTQVRVQLQAGL